MRIAGTIQIWLSEAERDFSNRHPGIPYPPTYEQEAQGNYPDRDRWLAIPLWERRRLASEARVIELEIKGANAAYVKSLQLPNENLASDREWEELDRQVRIAARQWLSEKWANQ